MIARSNILIRIYISAAMLTLVISATAPPGVCQISEVSRRSASAGENYDVIPNVAYRKVRGWTGRLDLYLPVDRESRRPPTLVWIHGGGWTQSSKEAEFLYVLPYLEMGWSVINVEYRLAKRSPAPGAVEDCRCALKWAIDNAGKYNINTEKIVISGISAGGHLALTTAAPPPRLPGTGCYLATKVAGVVNWFGPSDITDLLAGPNRFVQAVEWFSRSTNAASTARRISPVNYVNANFPPVITIHGDKDELIPYPQSVRFHKLLTAAGVPNELVTMKGRGHGGFSDNEWTEAYRSIREFLGKNAVK